MFVYYIFKNCKHSEYNVLNWSLEFLNNKSHHSLEFYNKLNQLWQLTKHYVLLNKTKYFFLLETKHIV